MRPQRGLPWGIVGLALAAALQAQAPPPAGSILADAQAAANHRAIFVVFHASWWGWCKKLDRFIESHDVKPVFDKYFITAHITVDENGDKKALNTPGGAELLKRLGGPAGLPFMAFLDDRGEMLVNSMAPGKNGKPGSNIGHPSDPGEVDWFMAMVGKAAPAMTRDEAAVLESYLRHQPK